MFLPPQQHKFGFKAWLPTIGLAFAAFVFNTSEFLPVGLLPNIADSIHESVSKTGLIITVYAWVVSLLSLPLTILTAKLERRRLLLWLVVIFALSHFAVLWANTFEKLMAARICVAVTHSVFWSIMTPLAARVAPFGRQALGLAAVMGGSIVATVLGVPIGTHLGQQFGWQGSFFIVGLAATFIWLIIFLSLPICVSNRAGSLKSLPSLFKRPALVQLYMLTMIVILGQFTVYSYITPILMTVGHLSENQTVAFLFIFGVAGILGTVISSKTVDRFRSGTMVVPMIIMAVCVGTIGIFAPHFEMLAVLGIFWGAAMTAISMAFQTLLLDTASDAADVATSLYSGIFNIGIGGGAFIGSRVSAHFGFAFIPYVACTLIGVCALACIVIWMKRGSAILPKAKGIGSQAPD